MGYKVSLEALDSMYDSVKGQTDKWLLELESAQKKLTALQETSKMAGVAADNVKLYIENVHLTLIMMLQQLVSLHSNNCLLYKMDYQQNVDSGLKFVINASELENYNTRIQATRSTAVEIDNAVAYVLSGINDIFYVKRNDIESVDSVHQKVSNYLVELDGKITDLEDSHNNNDFLNTSGMITNLNNFIRELLSADRSYRTDFTIEQMLKSENFLNLVQSLDAVSKEVEDKLSDIESATELQAQHVEALKESREWIQWVALGVAAIGAVALIVVTAGGATPLVCAGVGAAVGVTSAAASNFADNYVENGSLTEGMDWSKFGKECLIGGVTGAIGGYLGASSVGSAIKQPIQKAAFSAGSSMLEKGAEGLIDTAWDVGEAIVTKKPGDEVLSILEENTEDMLKNIVVGGAEGFAGGYVSGKFDVSSAKKGFFKKAGEGIAEGTAEAFAKNATDSAWDVGTAVLDPNSSENITTVLKKEASEFASGFTGDVVSNSVEAVIDSGNDAFNDAHEGKYNVVQETAKEAIVGAASETASTIAGSSAKQGVDILTGSRENFSMKEIWEKDLEGGRKIVKSGIESGAEHAADKAFEDQKLYNDLKKKDYDKDGKVEVVEFQNFSVLKEDFEAAKEVAKKGAYKDQSVQDILGLSKKTKITDKNIITRKVSIKDLEKSQYKGRKTTNVTRYDVKKSSTKK